MRKVCVVITSRPSYSRIASALVALRVRGAELQIVAAASAVMTRFGRIVDQIRADGFDVTAEISSVVEDDSLANSALSTGLLLTQLAGLFQRLRPDVVVTIADRHETLATAIAASYQNIPLCHIQGGEVTGSIDDRVRDAVTQLADLHCVATERAAARVTAMRPGARVEVVGCPSIDLANQALRLGPIAGADVIVLQHPVTNEVNRAAEQMRSTIEAVGVEALYLWPGEGAGSSAMSKELRLAGVSPVRNLPPLDFVRTLLGAKVLVGNSSVGIRECSFLGAPVVNIGSRQRGRERGPNVMDVPHDAAAIVAAIARQKQRRRYQVNTLYGDGYAGARIAGILAS